MLATILQRSTKVVLTVDEVGTEVLPGLDDLVHVPPRTGGGKSLVVPDHLVSGRNLPIGHPVIDKLKRGVDHFRRELVEHEVAHVGDAHTISRVHIPKIPASTNVHISIVADEEIGPDVRQMHVTNVPSLQTLHQLRTFDKSVASPSGRVRDYDVPGRMRHQLVVVHLPAAPVLLLVHVMVPFQHLYGAVVVPVCRSVFEKQDGGHRGDDCCENEDRHDYDGGSFPQERASLLSLEFGGGRCGGRWRLGLVHAL